MLVLILKYYYCMKDTLRYSFQEMMCIVSIYNPFTGILQRIHMQSVCGTFFHVDFNDVSKCQISRNGYMLFRIRKTCSLLNNLFIIHTEHYAHDMLRITDTTCLKCDLQMLKFIKHNESDTCHS